MPSGIASTLQDWFTGPPRDETPLPRFAALSVGTVAFTLERFAVLVLAYFAAGFSSRSGHEFLSGVAFLITVGFIALIGADFIRTFILEKPSLVRSRIADGVHYVPKWYARLIVVSLAVLAVILIVSLA